jgi:hypothetical protein
MEEAGRLIVVVMVVDVRHRMKRRRICMRALMWPRCVREERRGKRERERERDFIRNNTP